ncbi:KAP family P-loop NTPase fold protein [Salinigranum salinum]|uniref:KAP family P-loop NTPase fold protein n=1 Tax=Salinigranum salinum TaxID=1364937 RepID=UPI001260F45D|nr:P-loop NTPase fold protein [Salinigranum salinum]
MIDEGGRVFLSDEPIESPEQDKFEHREYVDALEQILENAEPRWNIGVFGKWGTGKSSIINLLFDRLQDNPAFDDTICVEFDAWTHAEESIRTDLLLGIDYQLGEKTDTKVDGEYGILGEDYITEELYDITEETGSEDLSYREYTARLLSHSKPVTGIVVIAAVVLVLGVLANVLNLVGVLNPDPDLMATVNSILQIAILPLFLSLFIFMAKQVEDATSTLRQRYPRKEWSGAYEQLFEEMLTDLVKKTEKKKVIISVDNLDRCESDTVYDVLVSLKTFMENDRCTYIIPCDDEALLSHVQSIDRGGYFEEPENEREFLRKLFQAHVRVPPFTNEAISDYARELKGQLDEDLGEDYDDEVLSVITKAYARNPRRIKQAFNRLTTLRMLAQEMEATDRMREGAITDNYPFLAKVSILQEDFPEFYRALQTNPRLLDEFNDYFAGRVSESEREKELAAYFDPDENEDNGSVEGLRDFLRTTRYITDDNPRRFIYLSEPSYALTLGDDERFVQDLRTGQVDKVRDELKSLFESDEDFTPYLEAIRDTLDEWSHLNSELFNIVEGLMEVFSALDEDSQSRVAAVVSEYLVSADRRHFLEDLDPHLSFPLLLKMPHRDSQILFNAYGQLAADPETLHENVLEAFVSHSDEIPRSARRPLAENLTHLRQNLQIDEFKRALDMLHSSAPAREKFATASLLKEAVELIELDNQHQFQNHEYYTKFDPQASIEARSTFVKKLIDLYNDVEDDNVKNLNQNLADILLDIEPDLTTPATRRLYDEFQGLVHAPSGDERQLVETLFHFYDVLVPSDQDEFRQQCVNQIQNWGSTAQQYLKWAEQYDVPLLNSENAVEAALAPFPNQNSNANLFTKTILPLIPEEFDEEVTAKKLLDILDSSDDSHAQLGAEIFLTAPERFSNVQDSVVDKCLSKANRTNDIKSKQTFLTAVSGVFTELKDSDQELFLSQLTELARGSNRDKQAFAQVWREVEDDLEPGHRRTIGQNVLSVLEDEASDQNQQVPNDELVKVLQSVTDYLTTNAHEEFVQRLSDKLTDGDIGWQQKQDIVGQLVAFEDLAGQEDLVLTRIEGMLKQNSQGRLHQTTEKKLNILEQRDKIDQERIKEIRKTYLET